MSATPPLVVVVPGLVWPRQTLADLSHALPTPALSSLLGLATRQAQITASAIELMLKACAACASPQPGFAALRQLARGNLTTDERWLCLDPVSLVFVERQLMLGDPRQLALTASEADQLAASLAPSFAAFGELIVEQPSQWSLRLHAETVAPSAPPLADIIGRRADRVLAALDRPWRQALNEAQMRLHTHPVNLAREAAGRPTVNSLWPWGGGELPQAPLPGGVAPSLLLANATEWHGLAQRCGGQAAALPPSWSGLGSTPTLALVDSLAFAARSGDAIAWRDELLRLERDWFAPLLDDIRRARLRGLRLEFPDDTATPRGGWRFDIGSLARLAFWRKPLPLTALAQPALPA